MANKPRVPKLAALQLLACIILTFTVILHTHGQNNVSRNKNPFNVLVLFENGGHHKAFTDAAQPWLLEAANKNHFKVDFYTTVDSFSDRLLSNYQLILQLDYVPYAWPDHAKQAFIRYMSKGKGGWVGLHHASLLGEFDGYPIWPWFQDFMGGIRFKNYIPDFATARVELEKPRHPVMRSIPSSFTIEKEEWYTYDQSPRGRVTVLATVNENTYRPDSEIKMGDHPVVWCNEKIKARNIYIFMGHSPILFQNNNYTRLLLNAIMWAAAQTN